MANKTLYTFVDNTGNAVFGIHVGTNSQNLYILEVEGRDDYLVVDPSLLEEVLPYTFSVVINGQEIHYIGTPGKVNKGDFLIIPTGNGHCIGRVKGVDTKNKGARAKLKGHKIVTESI